MRQLMDNPNDYNGVSIRQANNEDRAEIDRLMRCGFDLNYREGWSSDALSSLMQWPKCLVFLALNTNQNIVGFIAVRYGLEEAELLLIVIDPESRRQGIGCSLLEAMVERLGILKMRSIFLEVRENNHDAVRFYQKQAFVQVGTRPRYYQALDGTWAAALTMMRKL